MGYNLKTTKFLGVYAIIRSNTVIPYFTPSKFLLEKS